MTTARCPVGLRFAPAARLENEHPWSPKMRLTRTPVQIFIFLIAVTAGSLAISSGVAGQQTPAVADPSQFNEATRLSLRVAELYRDGKYDQALPLARRVVEITRSSFGVADARVAVALQNLAEIQIAKKNFLAGEETLAEAVAVFEKSAKRETSPAASALTRLAWLRYEKGDYEAAVVSFKRALEIRERQRNADDPALLENVWDLANAYSAAHKFNEAEHLALRALSIQEKRFGPRHSQTIELMKKYACGVVRIEREKAATEPAEGDFSDEEKALNARAICWTGELRANCGIDNQPLSSRWLNRGSVINEFATHLKVPFFPPSHGQSIGSGAVRLAVLIDESGKVIKAKAVCGDTSSRFVGVALAAAREADFPPTLIDGRAVQIAGFITYNYAYR